MLNVLKSFPAEDWVEGAREFIAKDTRYLPADWLTKGLIKVDPPDPGKLPAECAAVLKAKEERPLRLASIKGQASGSIAGLAELLGARRQCKLKNTATDELLVALNDELLPVLYYFKTKFNAARPSDYISDLNPMFAKPDPNYPGHPTYPSGHAAQTRMFALVMGELFSKLKTDLIRIADDIAFNRVVAGVHFQADSAAGQQLAEDVFALVKSHPWIQHQILLARAEWPENEHLI